MTGATRHPGRAALAEDEVAGQVLGGSSLFTSVRVVARTGSTNADLLAAAQRGVPAGAVLVAEEQTAGRGRLDRSWQSQPGASLTFSVLVRPRGVPPASRGWLPLLTGVAIATALRAQTGLDVSLKWPNDVLASGGVPGHTGKLAGILAEQTGDAIVVGIGLNVSSREDELPAGQATSLLLAGVPDPDRQAILIGALREFERWYLRWSGDPATAGVSASGLQAGGQSAPGDAGASGLRAEYLRCCATIGRDVRVELPGGTVLAGRACDVDGVGRLLVSVADGVHAVSAGDVVHVR